LAIDGVFVGRKTVKLTEEESTAPSSRPCVAASAVHDTPLLLHGAAGLGRSTCVRGRGRGLSTRKLGPAHVHVQEGPNYAQEQKNLNLPVPNVGAQRLSCWIGPTRLSPVGPG